MPSRPVFEKYVKRVKEVRKLKVKIRNLQARLTALSARRSRTENRVMRKGTVYLKEGAKIYFLLKLMSKGWTGRVINAGRTYNDAIAIQAAATAHRIATTIVYEYYEER